MGKVIVPTRQMGEQQFREVEPLAPGHTGSELWGLISEPPWWQQWHQKKLTFPFSSRSLAVTGV